MKMLLTSAALLSAIVCGARETAIYQGKLTSALNANGMVITNLPPPLSSGDAANKAYVDSVGGVTPSVVTNIADGRIDAKVTKEFVEALGIESGISTNSEGIVIADRFGFGSEYQNANFEIVEGFGVMKTTGTSKMKISDVGDGSLEIGRQEDPYNVTEASIYVGSKLLWFQSGNDIEGILYDWNTNTYTRAATDAAIFGAVSNRTEYSVFPKFVPMTGFYGNIYEYAVIPCALHPAAIATMGWNQYIKFDENFLPQTLPEYLDSREPNILSLAASDAQSRVDTATKSLTSYSWIRPDDWYVTFSSSNQFPSVTWVGETENDSGQIFSNEVRTVTHSIGGCASWENIDPNSTNYAPVEAWASYDAALTINGNGEFTAASNGLYRISAKRGNDYRYADVAAQILPAEVTTNMIYMRDAAASARKSVNDAAKTILQNATLVSSAGYNTYNTFKYHMTGAAAGNVKPFAVSAHVLVGASHYAVKPTGYQYFNDGNGHSANVYKLPWVSLSDWAATNGFSQVEISEANINDLYMIPCDKSTAVPDGCIPWFMSEYTAKEKFGSTMIGLQAWFAPQDHEYAVPCVLNSINGIAMRYSPSYYTEPLTRADICPILRDMGTQYQIKGGDSGRPMWINIDNKPVVLCGFHFGGGGSAGGGGENLMRGFNIIKAFVEWYGDTIKEYK